MPDPKMPDLKMLEVLVCPVTRTRLIYDAAAQELVSRAGGFAYPVVDGVPVMIADSARLLDEPL